MKTPSPAKAAKDHPTPVTDQDLEEEVDKDKLIGNFTEYMSSGEFDPSIYRRFQKHVSGSKLLSFILN